MIVDINNDNPVWRERPRQKQFWIVKTVDDAEPENYPVDVINVNGEVIGTANDKDEYLQIWNGDTANNPRGFLLGDERPFVFILVEDPLATANALLLENGEEILLENNDILIIE